MPVTTCEMYRDYVERVKQGDLRAMFVRRTRLLMSALTSGTTNQSKFIPVTHDFFREYRKSWNLWGIRTFQQHLDLLRKHVVQLSSDWQQFPTVAGIPCGNISGPVAETAPRISDPIFILLRSLIKIPNTFGKHYAALRISMASERVGMIMTANPSTLVDFARFADQQRESLVRDIHDGTVSPDIEIPVDIRATFRQRYGRRNPDRARQLSENRIT